MRWSSKTEPVKAGEPTWLALIETALAVALYWGLAWYFDDHRHLLWSVSIAPFLLLRSDASVKTGVRWFQAELEIDREKTPVRFWGFVLFFFTLSAITAFGITHWLGQEWLPKHDGWSLFWRAISLGFFTTHISLILFLALKLAEAEAVVEAVAVTAAAGTLMEFFRAENILLISPTISFAILSAYKSEISLSMLSGMIISVLVARDRPAHIDLATQLLLFPMMFSIDWPNEKAHNLKQIASNISIYAIFCFPFSLIIWLRSLGVRVAATVRHPCQGLRALPDNWRHTLLTLDSHHPPELLPGLNHKKNSEFSWSNIKSWCQSKLLWERLLGCVFLFIYSTTALAYRLSLKSTCWLYFPLIYLARTPKWHGRKGNPPEEQEPESVWLSLWQGVKRVVQPAPERAGLVDDLRNGVLEKFRWGATALVLASVILTTHTPAILEELFPGVAAMPTLLRLFAFDLTRLAPWQWSALASGGLTLLILCVSDPTHRHWQRQLRRDPTAQPHGPSSVLLFYLALGRGLCGLASVVLALGFAWAAHLHLHAHQLPHWLAFLGVLYGPWLAH